MCCIASEMRQHICRILRILTLNLFGDDDAILYNVVDIPHCRQRCANSEPTCILDPHFTSEVKAYRMLMLV